VTADGQRFILKNLVAEAAYTPITVVLNWGQRVETLNWIRRYRSRASSIVGEGILELFKRASFVLSGVCDPFNESLRDVKAKSLPG